MKNAQYSMERVFGTYGKVERSDMNENLSCVWGFFFFLLKNEVMRLSDVVSSISKGSLVKSRSYKLILSN